MNSAIEMVKGLFDYMDFLDELSIKETGKPCPYKSEESEWLKKLIIQHEEKNMKLTNEQIKQAEKSLRWVANQIPNNLGNSNEERMLKCIRLYCYNGAEVISQLSKELTEIRNNREKNKW